MDQPSPSRLDRWRGRFKRMVAAIRRAVPFVGGVAAALVAVLLYNLLFPPPPPLNTQDVNNAIASAMASATPPPAFSQTVYQIIRPSLILIQTSLPATADGKADHGLGSGVIIDDSGDILTSLHVVADATDIQVTFADGTSSSATITTRQPEIDIAVIKADNPPAQIVPATLGNPASLRVGDEAYVVGNPFGLYGSMTAGVVSGFGRTFAPPNSTQKLEGLIQIDSAVNPGNSGGPVLNRYGQVIGIAEGILNPTGQDVFIGIGFAVPINVAGGAAGSPPD
jgi:S1-C subfamily serine protease